MKKQIILIAAAAIFVVIAAVLFFSGATESSLTGSYKLVDASGTGSEMFKATVDDAVLVINEDNTGTFSMSSQTTPVVVDAEHNKLSFDGGKNYTPYIVDGKKLTVEHNGYKAVFKKK